MQNNYTSGAKFVIQSYSMDFLLKNVGNILISIYEI